MPLAQRVLDRDLADRAVEFLKAQRHLDLPHLPPLPPDDPLASALVPALVPAVVRIAEQTIDAAVATTVRRSIEFDVGLRVGGQLVAAFYQARYATSETRQDRLSVHVVAVPSSPDVLRRAAAPPGGWSARGPTVGADG